MHTMQILILKECTLVQILKDRILKEGLIIDNRILKVDGFLNHQIDPTLLMQVGQEFAKRFADAEITKIVTVEASGIAVALAAALAMNNVPIVFARKKKSILMTDDVFHAKVFSYTKEEHYDLTISRKFLQPGEKVLVLDDFLASGEAAIGLSELVTAANCTVVGIGIVIEKSFQPGRQRLIDAGYRVESLVRVEKFENNIPVFIEE